MSSPLVIGVIGDYDGRPSHVATNEALAHAAARLGHELDVRWLPTPVMVNRPSAAVVAGPGHQ